MANRMVEFSSNGATCRGYLSLPQSGRGPGVVVIQEWWGLVDHIKDVCDRLADQGFVCLAPDLYHGESTSSPDQAEKLMMALNISKAEKDLAGAINYLLQQQETTGDLVGTVGFCMGGQLSLFAACENERVGACVVYYGIHPAVQPDLAKLQAPVLGFFAEKDAFVPPEAVRKLEADLNKLGKKNEIHIYENANHGFFNDTMKNNYNESHARDTFKKMVSFFRQYLGS